MEKTKVINSKQTSNQREGKRNTRFRFARSLFAFGLGLVFLGGVAVFASKGGESILSFLRPSVNINLSGTVSRDEGKIDLNKAGDVRPGEIIEWKIESENSGDGAASNYKAIGQVPNGTEYVAGSANAQDSPVVEYSIDGGRNFSERPLIKVKQPDGSDKQVPAPASMYTQVRFSWSNPIDSGKKFNAYYSVRVK